MHPKFSIVLPTYNRAGMAAAALRTVQYQTVDDWECIVVDDGSTDDTRQALHKFREDRRIRIIHFDRNRGMNASRNEAIEGACGEFVTFLDSDDLWLPSRLEHFCERFTATPAAGFVFSNAYLWRFDRILGTLFDPKRAIPEGVLPGHYAVGDRYLPYVTTNVAIRREAFDRWGLFRTEMKTLDTELFARFLAQGLPVAAIKAPLSVRRLHDDQLTDRYLENFQESLLALKSTGISGELYRSEHENICRAVAVYLLKAGHPLRAREFLARELGNSVTSTPLFRMTFIPGNVLMLAKGLRRRWLMLRHHPAWASTEVREIYRIIRPVLSAE